MIKFDWIRSQHLPDESAFALASRLNTPSLVPNPEPERNIPRPITITEIAALCTPAERFAASETLTYTRALEAFLSGNREDTINYFTFLVEGGIIGTESAQAIGALLTETIPAPRSEQVMLSPAQLAGYGLVTVDEVVEALASLP